LSKVNPFDPQIDFVSGTDLNALQRLVSPWMDVEWLEADWVGGADGVCGAGVRLTPKHRLFLVHAEGHRPVPPQLAAEARRVAGLYRLLADWLDDLPENVTEWEMVDEEPVNLTDAGKDLFKGVPAR
jgi:hypothetical protein